MMEVMQLKWDKSWCSEDSVRSTDELAWRFQ